MARIRSIHPDLHRDKTLAQASATAERTFVRLWCHLDDDGRGEDDPDLLKADLYPRHREMGPGEIEADLAELDKLGLVIRYVIEGERYLACKASTWAKYQRPQKKMDSVLPPPPERSNVPTGDLHDQDDSPTGPLPPVVEGRGEGVGGEASRDKSRSGRATRLPDGWIPEADEAGPSRPVPTQPNQKDRAADATPPADPVTESFNRFWELYPRGQAGKTGGDGARKPTLQRWRRLTNAEREACLKAVDHYRRHVESPDGPHAAYALTWLNQERWEQWQTPGASGGRQRGRLIG